MRGPASSAYAFQIYFDFSGYSDMAIGLGLMFGFVFAKNFDSPYLSQSITEFWRRWHISLSTWLRDYLYVPLGGNRKGPARTYVNLRHRDAARRPVARRVVELPGVGRDARHDARRSSARGAARRPTGGCPAPLRVALDVRAVLFTWVFFRAPDLPSAVRYLSWMFGAGEPGGGGGLHRRPDLSAVLPADDGRLGAGRVDVPADVGLVAHA